MKKPKIHKLVASDGLIVWYQPEWMQDRTRRILRDYRRKGGKL